VHRGKETRAETNFRICGYKIPPEEVTFELSPHVKEVAQGGGRNKDKGIEWERAILNV
jgi:hypothetical protein